MSDKPLPIFLPRQGRPQPVATAGELELRRRYLYEESAIYTIGLLHSAVGWGLIILGGVSLFLVLSEPHWFRAKLQTPEIARFLISGSLIVVGILLRISSHGLCRFRMWARGVTTWMAIAEILLTPLRLLLFVAIGTSEGHMTIPVGSSICHLAGVIYSVYVLRVLYSHGAANIFANDYERVVAATPEIKRIWRESIVLPVFLWAIIAAFAIGSLK